MLIQIVWFLKLVGFWSCDHVGVLGFVLTLCHYAPDTCSTCNKLWTSIELCIFGCDSGWTLRTYCCIQYTSEINFLLYIALTSKKWILVYLEDVSKTMCIEPFSSTSIFFGRISSFAPHDDDDRYVAFAKSPPWFLPNYYTPVGAKVPLPLFIKVWVGWRVPDDDGWSIVNTLRGGRSLHGLR